MPWIYVALVKIPKALFIKPFFTVHSHTAGAKLHEATAALHQTDLNLLPHTVNGIGRRGGSKETTSISFTSSSSPWLQVFDFISNAAAPPHQFRRHMTWRQRLSRQQIFHSVKQT